MRQTKVFTGTLNRAKFCRCFFSAFQKSTLASLSFSSEPSRYIIMQFLFTDYSYQSSERGLYFQKMIQVDSKRKKTSGYQREREESINQVFGTNICSLLSCSVALCDPTDCSLPGSSPWDFVGKDARVGCHFLSQGIFPTQGSNLVSCVYCMGRQILYHLTPPGKQHIHTTIYKIG